MNATKAMMSARGARTFGLVVAWIALLPVQAHALSLGGFQVKSALDEPLEAEIQLESVDPQTLETLEITLATPADFQRAEVPRSEFLGQLQFSINDQGSRAVVVVTTVEPMKEPFLHFLVSAQWSSGKLVREYTGLLDPPLYASEPPASVESPSVAEAPETVTPSEPEPEPETTGASSQSSTSGTVSVSGQSAEYGPTREGDTLWSIASRLDTGAIRANVFQVMIALQRQNPDAFIDNNINQLRTGQVLRLDDIASIADISAAQASVAYTAQLEEWQAQTGTAVASTGGEAQTSGQAESTAMADSGTDAGETASPASATDQAAADTSTGAVEAEDDVLRIVQATLDESGQSDTASAGSDRSGEVGELRGRIATLQETLESRNLENQELRERVGLLENQLQNAQRLVELESQELAAAQEQAAQRQGTEEAETSAQQVNVQSMEEQSAQPEEEIAQPEEQGMAQEPESASDARAETAMSESEDTGQASQQNESGEAAQSSQQASTVTSAASSAAQSGETERLRTVSNRPPSSSSWWSGLPDALFSSWMWMVGAAAGVLVLVLGLLMFLRRRQSIAEFEESILSGSALDSYSETTDTAGTSASDTSFLSDFGTAGMGTMQADEVDPLAEAEVYLAYGRDEQAEDVLKEAARRDPQRTEVKLKLLEIYKQRGDVKSFETIAEELYPAGDQGDVEAWRKVTAMGREVNPGNPLFQESAEEGPEEETAGGTMPAGAAAAGAGAASMAAQAADTGGREDSSSLENFDFDFDEHEPSDLKAAPGFESEESDPAGAQAEAGDMELEFDTDRPADARTPAKAVDHGDLDFGDEFLEQASRSVDPAMQPFPAPDQQTDLDRELDRLAGEREAHTPPVTSAEARGASRGNGNDEPASRDIDWETAKSDTSTLDFPSTDSSEIEFDLNLDDSSIQRLSGAGSDSGSGQSDRFADTDDGVLEFESEHIPPEETWAGPSSDAAPGGAGEAAPDDFNDSQAPGDGGQYNEADTKLDLARAYLDMGDKVGARSIIDEVMREGDPAQRDQAAALAAQL